MNGYHGQLLSCTISEKPKDPVLRKLGSEGRTDGQMDKSDFIGCCPTNIERPTIKNILSNFIPHETIVCDDREPPRISSKTKNLIAEKKYR